VVGDLPRRPSSARQRQREPLGGLWQSLGRRNLRDGDTRRHLRLQAVHGDFLDEAEQPIEYEGDELGDGLT
jgi:hypothetical protein